MMMNEVENLNKNVKKNRRCEYSVKNSIKQVITIPIDSSNNELTIIPTNSSWWPHVIIYRWGWGSISGVVVHRRRTRE